MILELSRDFSDATCTLGWLTVAGRKFTTIERPWVPDPAYPAGLKGQSCVPRGEYRLERHDSDAFPRCWALVAPPLGVYHWPWEVPVQQRAWARTAVLIHAANWASELRGCIAPGKDRVKDRNGWMVVRSRDALNEVRTLTGSAIDLRLVITGV